MTADITRSDLRLAWNNYYPLFYDVHLGKHIAYLYPNLIPLGKNPPGSVSEWGLFHLGSDGKYNNIEFSYEVAIKYS